MFCEHCQRIVTLASNMPVCCRCNGSGCCKSCSCSRAGTPCTNCLPLHKSKCCNGGHNDEPTSQPSPQYRALSPNPSYKQKENENEATEPSLNERFPNNKAMPMASDQLELDNQEMQPPNSSMVSNHSENIIDGSMDGQSQLNHPLTSSTL